MSKRLPKGAENKMEFKAAIFDVDGVIIDTAHIHHKSWKEVFRAYGINFTYNDFKNKIDGMPRDKGIKKILPGLAKNRVDRESANKQKYFESFFKKEKVKVFKSTINFIKKLKARGYKVAMASSSRNAGPILKKLGYYSCFDADAEGAFIKKGKPYPDIFIKASKKLKCSPKECVVFEDAESGVEAAKKAGMKCVGINRMGSHSFRKADITVRDIREINIVTIKGLFKKERVKNG